jgi:hypothetical protein
LLVVVLWGLGEEVKWNGGRVGNWRWLELEEPESVRSMGELGRDDKGRGEMGEGELDEEGDDVFVG